LRRHEDGHQQVEADEVVDRVAAHQVRGDDVVERGLAGGDAIDRRDEHERLADALGEHGAIGLAAVHPAGAREQHGVADVAVDRCGERAVRVDALLGVGGHDRGEEEE
jgi:hypothetical protein